MSDREYMTMGAEKDPPVCEKPVRNNERQQNKSSHILTAPAMFSEEITLKFGQSLEEPFQVSIHDVLGNLIFDQHVSSSLYSLTLGGDKISRLPAGVYFLSISNDSNIVAQLKLVKTKG